MKTTISALALLVSALAFQPSFASTDTYLVSPKDIHGGFIIKKIWLDSYALPDVRIAGVTYTGNVALPADAKTADPSNIQVQIGMERKRPFLVVRIPAYVSPQTGMVNQVSGYTLTVNEQPVTKTTTAARTTDVSSSVLATGTWYKIAVTKTGFYKIDASFITSMGLKPSDINPANIRICGNGGYMLSEDNRVSRPSDLTENAVQINGNGDNVFDNDESVVFYGVGTTQWFEDSVNQRFVHVNNLYSDTAYYFISFNSGAGKSIGSQATASPSNVTVNTYNYYGVHEPDLICPAKLGKLWYGETFNPQLSNTTQTFSFDIGTTVSSVYCAMAMGSTSTHGNCTATASVNGNYACTNTFVSPTSGDDIMNFAASGGTAACNSSVANVTVNFVANQDGIGYLYYLELNARAGLTMTGDQLNFRDLQSVGANHSASFQLQGANGNTRVWDITNPQVPVLMNGSLSGSTYTFTQDATTLHEFAAMNSSNLYAPKYIGTVPNQNLHGLTAQDLLIVTYPGYLTQANQLADYHRQHDGLRTVVATTTEVYNEFSSGGQDLSAIRDFARMLYKRAADSTQMPRYLLLFGGASYDYKNRVANNSNYVPVFESAESFNDLSSFCTDDFFGFLDDNEYIENIGIINALDIGVGRLPARSQEDATAMVKKIINYTSAPTLGPWRVSTTIVADMGCVGNNQIDAAGNHMSDAEAMATTVAETGNNIYNNQKVYVDAIPVISTPAGARCPNANAAINEQVFNGTFLINYNGHGNPTVWSSERILTQDDYNNWNNINALPFMVTATCDFGQFDQPQVVSSAEAMVVRDGGGVIAILTTTQAVYATFNHDLNVQYLTAQFTKNANNTWNTFGDASREGKNVTYNITHDTQKTVNFRKFSLLGDPALTPDFPRYTVKLDSIVDGYSQQQTRYVKALGAYTVDGSVRDDNGNVLSDFNGMLSVSFFDKPRTVAVITGCNETYQQQDNIVYKGRVTVTNGKFSFAFITPKDINYYLGTGKISTYTDNGVTDATGADTSLQVGGFSDHPVISSEPPIVKAYINDSMFLNGGITGSNTSLFVSLYDKTGINVSGTNVGHDLVAVLDDNQDAPYILNNYYQTAPNTYQHGTVTFPINGLADGPHSIKVRAWDVNDNEGEGTVDFTVVDGKVMAIQQLGNYPNPFTNTTHFVFEHNHPDEALNVQIEVYTTGGALAKSIKQDITPSGSRTADITWDGTDNSGNRLPSGVYVYRLSITTDKGFKSSAYQKLVIVR